MRRCLYGHPPGHLAHGRKERQRTVRRLDRLVGDGVDLTLHQELREPLVSSQMQVGEELLTLPKAVVLLGDRLLDLDDQIRRLENLLRPLDNTRTRLLVLLVSKTRAFSGTGLDVYLVAMVDQLGYAVRLHGDSALHVLDLLRYPYYRRHAPSFPSSHPHSSLPYSKVTINVQGCWQRQLFVVPSKRLLACLPVPGACVGTQPQSDVLGPHRLPHHCHQVVAQGIEVCLVPELDGEALKRLSGVILLAVEAPIYERLHAPSQRVEQGCYR